MGLAGPVHAMAVSSAISHSKWNWDHPCLRQPCPPITYTLPCEDGSEHFPTSTVTSMPAPFWGRSTSIYGGDRKLVITCLDADPSIWWAEGREGKKGEGKEKCRRGCEGRRWMHTPGVDRCALSEMRPTWSHCMQLNRHPTPATSCLHLSFPPTNRACCPSLHQKQPHLAVIYCTNGGFTAWPAPLDRRAVSFQASLAFSASEGIVSEVVYMSCT